MDKNNGKPDMKKIAELAANPNRKVSITYQDREGQKNALRQLAKDLGFTRENSGELVGEVGPAVVLATEFMFANLTQFREWLAKGKPQAKKKNIRDVILGQAPDMPTKPELTRP